MSIWVIAGICCAIEAVLTAGDLGLLGPRDLRGFAYRLGAFWPHLLGPWQAVFPLQPGTMFLSHAFLHAGPIHLGVNMLTLLSLGPPVLRRVGAVRFWAVYAVTAITGAALFGLLSGGPGPMVGASGALFGLAGALVFWAHADRMAAGAGLRPVAGFVAVLVALNVVFFFGLGGALAWQAHLGGFLGGWAMAALVDPRPRP